MVSRKKIITFIIILLLLSVFFSGCTEENRNDQGLLLNDSVDNNSTNLELPEKEENITQVIVNPSS